MARTNPLKQYILGYAHVVQPIKACSYSTIRCLYPVIYGNAVCGIGCTN